MALAAISPRAAAFVRMEQAARFRRALTASAQRHPTLVGHTHEWATKPAQARRLLNDAHALDAAARAGGLRLT